MTAPQDNQPDGYLIVCEDHGELTDSAAADRIVADVVKEEHREQGCHAPINVYRAESLEFEPAGSFAVADDDDQRQATFEGPEGDDADG